MTYWVYIIQSEKDGSFYKGFSTNLSIRMIFHNQGLSPYTKRKTPWKLVFKKEFSTKKEALSFEMQIKRWNQKSLQKLIMHPIVENQ